MNLPQEIESINQQTESCLKKAVSELGCLIALTEEKYAYVYEALPRTEKDIELIMKEVETLLNYLIYWNDTGGEKQRESVIIDALSRIQKEFEEITESFLNQDLIGVLQKAFLDESGQEDQSFSKMGRLAREVRDTLADLRDLALNSLIFSIRVGDQGAGFQILADRINQISSSLGDEFSQMDEAMEELEVWHKDFQKKLVEFIDYEENLKSKYQDKFNQEFSNIKYVLKATCQLLNNHLGNTKTVVTRVPEAMVLIQTQDIIRQNIENLVKCLNIAMEKKPSSDLNQDEVLNYIVFLKKVIELSPLLLNNIENGLAESIQLLEELLRDIYQQATDLETEARYLGAFFAGAGEVPADWDFNVMNDVFSTVMGQVVDLLYIKRHIETKSELLLGGRESFIRLMDKVESDFGAINREVKTLKKMRVLIKIELARINQLDNNSMNNIVAAVDEVVETVNSNQVLFNRLRTYFIKNIEEFNSAVEGTKAKLAYSTEALANSKDKLGSARNLAGGAVQAMVKEMGDIFQELRTPFLNIQVMDDVRDMLSEVRQQIREYEEYIQVKETELFRHYGVSHWEEKEEDLKALLEQFTCYVERKSATAVFDDFSEELGEQSSDIVLF